MSNSKVMPIEMILYRYFVKYERLDQIIKYALSHSKACGANLFIDLYGLYRTICSRTYASECTNYISFVPTLVNMCAHYRTYFKQMRVYPKIFIISGYNVPDISRKFVAEYNKTMIDKLKNDKAQDIVNFNTQVLEILCPYLPDIHFIHNNNFESSVIMKHIIETEISNGNNNPNIIISSDIYPMQLCYQYTDTVFIKPNKSQGIDSSMITCIRENPNFINSFWKLIASSRSQITTGENEVKISPVNYSLMSALTRFPERDIKTSIRFDIAQRSIYNIIGSDNVILMPEVVYNSTPEINTKMSLNTLESRFKVLDLQYQYTLFNQSIDKSVIHYENLNDPEAVKLINDTYYQDNPIDIFHL